MHLMVENEVISTVAGVLVDDSIDINSRVLTEWMGRFHECIRGCANDLELTAREIIEYLN
jgi:hypothetical protein